jgi:hypothetical protein
MRTTLTIDDQIATALKDVAHRSGKPYKQVVNEALRLGLHQMRHPRATRPYRLQPASMGAARAGIDLDKALQLAEALEDEALLAKLEQRK